MQTVLGLIGFVLYIAAVIALAAAVTWLVVRLTPAPKKKSDTLTEA
jgi:flagellar biogenesis protein FliO